jgi:hypothetical protein
MGSLIEGNNSAACCYGIAAIWGKFVRLCGSGAIARSAPLALHHRANLSKSKKFLFEHGAPLKILLRPGSMKPQPRLSLSGMLSEKRVGRIHQMDAGWYSTFVGLSEDKEACAVVREPGS